MNVAPQNMSIILKTSFLIPSNNGIHWRWGIALKKGGNGIFQHPLNRKVGAAGLCLE